MMNVLLWPNTAVKIIHFLTTDFAQATPIYIVLCFLRLSTVWKLPWAASQPNSHFLWHFESLTCQLPDARYLYLTLPFFLKKKKKLTFGINSLKIHVAISNRVEIPGSLNWILNHIVFTGQNWSNYILFFPWNV